MVQGSSRNFASATLSSVDICRARASATWSPTVLPSRTLPRRGMLPPANSRASINVVLPDRYGPTRATQRWPAALGMGISIRSVSAVPAYVIGGRRGFSLSWIVARAPDRGNRNLVGRQPTGHSSRFGGAGLAERAAGAVNAGAGLAQFLGRGGVGDAEMRRQPKRRAMHDRHALGFEQITSEILVILDRVALGGALADQAGAGRIDIKRACRPRAMEARHPVKRIDDEVAPVLEHGGVPRDEILRPIERLDPRGLADRPRLSGSTSPD